jgi:membrane protein YqaA with SNARE-associated domain
MRTLSTQAAYFPAELAAAPRASAYDRFVHSRIALCTAFVWGLAEATFFFIVPDVLITLLACRSLRPALKASVAALLGALLGGSLMFVCAAQRPDVMQRYLLRVPAIDAELVMQVQQQVETRGLASVLSGPLAGIPYKIYAVVLGAAGGDWLRFLLISIPARYTRFY